MTTGHEGQTYPPKLKAQHFRIAWRQLDDDDKVEVLNWLTEEAGVEYHPGQAMFQASRTTDWRRTRSALERRRERMEARSHG